MAGSKIAEAFVEIFVRNQNFARELNKSKKQFNDTVQGMARGGAAGAKAFDAAAASAKKAGNVWRDANGRLRDMRGRFVGDGGFGAAGSSGVKFLGILRQIAGAYAVIRGARMAGGFLGGSIQTFAQFDDQMRTVKAVTQASDQQFASMTETARRLGATTSFTASEVGALMAELGRAGFQPDQINTATGAILDLSRATGTDAARSADIVGKAINQFGLQASDASKLADAFTVAANKSAVSVESLGTTMEYAGPVAADFGLTIQEALALAGSLGNIGISGSSAGTALRRLLTLTAADAQKLESIFGVSFVDAAGNARPLIDALADVHEKTKDLGTAARGEMFKQGFGLLGITAASALGKASVSAKQLHADILAGGGAARTAAEEMDAGMGGASRKLASAWESLKISMGEALVKGLDLVPVFERLVGLVNQMNEAAGNDNTTGGRAIGFGRAILNQNLSNAEAVADFLFAPPDEQGGDSIFGIGDNPLKRAMRGGRSPTFDFQAMMERPDDLSDLAPPPLRFDSPSAPTVGDTAAPRSGFSSWPEFQQRAAFGEWINSPAGTRTSMIQPARDQDWDAVRRNRMAPVRAPIVPDERPVSARGISAMFPGTTGFGAAFAGVPGLGDTVEKNLTGPMGFSPTTGFAGIGAMFAPGAMEALQRGDSLLPVGGGQLGGTTDFLSSIQRAVFQDEKDDKTAVIAKIIEKLDKETPKVVDKIIEAIKSIDSSSGFGR